MNFTEILSWIRKTANGRELFVVQYQNTTITIHNSELVWLEFDGEEPMLVENVSEEFMTKLIKYGNLRNNRVHI